MQSDYEKNLTHLFDSDSSRIFSNGMVDHAAAIIREFFKRAENEVNIFCSNLLKHAFSTDAMKAALRDAFYRNVQVNILVQSDAEAKDFIKYAKELNASVSEPRICIWQNTNEEIEDIPSNLSVMDKKAYRVEADKSQHKAYACANDSIEATRVYDLLQRIFQCAKTLNVKNLATS